VGKESGKTSSDKLHHLTMQACTAREWHVHSLPTRVKSLLCDVHVDSRDAKGGGEPMLASGCSLHEPHARVNLCQVQHSPHSAGGHTARLCDSCTAVTWMFHICQSLTLVQRPSMCSHGLTESSCVHLHQYQMAANHQYQFMNHAAL
jgi:hypothetical protein